MRFLICLASLGFLFGCYVVPESPKVVQEKRGVIQVSHTHDHNCEPAQNIREGGCRYYYAYYSALFDEFVYKRSANSRKRGCKRKLYIPHY